jgi:two-component system OmpR family sensor kinase
MSSSRPSDAPVDRPDPADLPDPDGAPSPDLAPEGVDFADEPEKEPADDQRTYAVRLAPAVEPRPSVRRRLADVQDRVRPWSAWTLRAKLVASTLALFVVLSTAIGALTVVALDRQLTGQVDDQLNSAIQQIFSDRRGPDFGVTDHGPRGPGDEGLLAFIPSSPTEDYPGPLGRVSVDRDPKGLTTTQLNELNAAALGREPENVSLNGLGTYRLRALSAGLQPTPSSAVTPGALVVGLPIEPVQRTIQQMVVVVVMAVGAGILLMALLGTWLVRRNLEPLRRVAATATKVAKMPLHSGKVALAERVDPADTDTRTEVGQVGAAFNEMLDHVDEALNARHQSEQRVRQFVADASHELRTPLASIKGYAELSRREPNAVPQTVTHAMGRIESEANRMSSLVEDLLLLARLDAGRPLEEAPVDVSMLVINAVSDAHAASPGHRWDLDLPPEPVEVRGDAARLHQVVANLLGNARTHTPDGTRVTTSVRPEGEWVRVAVHDDGPGVPESLQPNVFERFARGDDARVRAGGSTGLGLSIVAAVSKAHGGRVELDSKPGNTTFSLLLPAAV